MRWRMLGLCAVATVGLGCPETYGIDGSADQAMSKDMKSLAEESLPCPPKPEAKALCAKSNGKHCREECL